MLLNDFADIWLHARRDIFRSGLQLGRLFGILDERYLFIGELR